MNFPDGLDDMTFKTLSKDDTARVAAVPLDYEWDSTIGNGFLAASDEEHPRLADAIEALNIHGAADLVIGGIEWCLARTQAHVQAADGQLRLQAAWAGTVDLRYSALSEMPTDDLTVEDFWTRPELRARDFLEYMTSYMAQGRTAKVRQCALGAVLLAEHLCGRDLAFGPWLVNMLRTKTASSPRRPDDIDFNSRDRSLPEPQELTAPTREERLAGLDPATNPYLRSAADMAALGFVGDPYPQLP